MKRLLEYIAHRVVQYPNRIIAVFIILAGVGGLLASFKIEMNTDQDALISEDLDADYNLRYREYLKEAGDLEYLYVVARVRNISEACRFADVTSEKLRNTHGIREVIGRFDLGFFQDRFIHYLPDENLDDMAGFIEEQPDLFTKLAKVDSLAGLFDLFNSLIAAAGRNENEEDSPLEGVMVVVERILDAATKALGSSITYASPFDNMEDMIGDVPPGYLFTSNRKLILVMVLPDKDYSTLSVIQEPLNNIRKIMNEVRDEFPGLEVGLTGRPVLQADEMETTNRDMIRASFLSVAAVAAIFIFFFRSLLHPLLAVGTLVISIGAAFGVIALVVGELNLLSVVFSIILVGLGIDFGIFIVARYQDERRLNNTPKASVITTLSTTGISTIAGAATTITAFLTAQLTDFKGLADLGLVTAIGILICLAGMLVFLPAALFKTDRNKALPPQRLFGQVLGRVIAAYPVRVLVILMLGTCVCLPLIRRVGFNDNLLDLQSRDLESVAWEKILIEESDESTWFAVSFVDDLDKVKQFAHAYEKLASVGRVETVLDALPQDNPDRRIRITQIRKAVQDLQMTPSAQALDAQQLKQSILQLVDQLEELTELAFEGGKTEAVTVLANMTDRLYSLDDALGAASKEDLLRLGDYQVNLAGDLGKMLWRFQHALKIGPPVPQDLPETFLRRYLGSKGRYLVHVYPKYNIWEPDKMAQFVKDIRSTDPEVTGVPIQVYESSRLVRRAFAQAACYTLVLVFLLLCVVFKSALNALLCLVPLACAILWLLLGMGLTGVPFNLANFFAIPILIGIGIDGSVHMLHRYLSNKDIVLTLQRTGIPVMLTYLTTMLGFGSLMTAHHRGLASLGQLMAMGSLTCMLSTLVVMPAILYLVGKTICKTEVANHHPNKRDIKS